MTHRGARLVLGTAALALGAAGLSWLAPSLPEGLGAACAPDLVLRELLAGLAALVLLVGPSFLADEPGRPAECHDGLLAALAAAPAAVALAAAGGLSPADLLPSAALLLACDSAASSYLRLDPSGRRGTLFAAAGAALLAGIPVAAYGFAEFGGWEGAADAFRLSPLLAVREVGGGWGAVGPATLLLLAIAAVLRLGGALLRAPALALVLLVPSADATVLVVGAPREGDYAALASGLRARGRVLREVDALPDELPWPTRIVVFARPPRSAEEGARWEARSREFAALGVNVVMGPGALPRPSRTLGHRHDTALPPLDLLLAPVVAVPHPADGPEPGVNPGIHRLPFPVPPRSLPGSSFGFLLVLAAALAGGTVTARRWNLGAARSGLLLGGIAAVGTSLLFLPGVLGPTFRIDRLVLEERIEGEPSARRVEILRVERLRPGGEVPLVHGTELRYSADSGPGRFAIFASATGVVEAGPEPREFLATMHLPGVPSDLRRSENPRVRRAAALIAECVRPPEGMGPLLVGIPASGPDAVVIHPR